MKRLRAAAVSFLNARPLTAALEGSSRFELVLAEPSRCASLLEEGEVDLALLPVGALVGKAYEIVPGVAIGADGLVSTVVLVGEQSPAVWDEVYLDTASRTSQLLARIVLAERGFHPRFTQRPAAEGVPAARGQKGALVIGDRAFDVAANHVLDLGREWTHLSGLPMIFALWAARPGVLGPEEVAEVTRAAREGLGRRTELAQEFARERGGEAERYRRYLTQRIRYGLGPYELQGLEAFLAKVAEHGLGPRTVLSFVGDRPPTSTGKNSLRSPMTSPSHPPPPGGGGKGVGGPRWTPCCSSPPTAPASPPPRPSCSTPGPRSSSSASPPTRAGARSTPTAW